MENEPDEYPGDDFWLSAFYQLSSCRHLGSGMPGPIPWTAIVLYADRRGLYLETSEMLEMVIGALDDVYLKWYARKQKALSKTPKNKGRSHG